MNGRAAGPGHNIAIDRSREEEREHVFGHQLMVVLVRMEVKETQDEEEH